MGIDDAVGEPLFVEIETRSRHACYFSRGVLALVKDRDRMVRRGIVKIGTGRTSVWEGPM